MDEILKYFPSLTDTQRRQFTALRELYGTWNEKSTSYPAGTSTICT